MVALDFSSDTLSGNLEPRKNRARNLTVKESKCCLPHVEIDLIKTSVQLTFDLQFLVPLPAGAEDGLFPPRKVVVVKA